MTFVKSSLLPLAAVCVLTAGCTWVKLTDAGADVQSVTSADVDGCTFLGRATSRTQHKVVVNRNATKVRAELQALGRNEAATMGGNAIVPEGDAVDGHQVFLVYQCE